MSNLSDIVSRIEKFNFDYIVSEEGILSDEGVYNVPLENNDNVRYLFSDSNEFGSRNPLEVKKIKMMNDSLEILFDIYTYASQMDPNYYARLMGASIDMREQYEQEAILDDAPPDGGVESEPQQVVEQQDSQKTVDIEVEDLSETMDTMGL
tara:strand:+ start:332 stop:784 length:453 start_codon:yes stop_codon:yes gene_type:complete